MKIKAFLLVSLSAALLGSAHAITIQTVTIGDLGNPNDPTTGSLYGGVAASYAIGKYEVSLLEYNVLPQCGRRDRHLQPLQRQHGDEPEHRGHPAGRNQRDV